MQDDVARYLRNQGSVSFDPVLWIRPMDVLQRPIRWVVGSDAHLDRFVRSQLPGVSWSRVRELVRTGKIFVNGQRAEEPSSPVRQGDEVRYEPTAPRAEVRNRLASQAIVYVDAHVVVVDKPAGISTVPYEDSEKGSLRDLVRAWLNRTAKARADRRSGDLGVVHRIDKQTSGLVVFTRNLAAKRFLANQFRKHTVGREYLAIAHGPVTTQTFESWLVQDRGDGLRGSTKVRGKGKRALTHVTAEMSLRGATLISCRLETGRTHQIRIHLSEAGHPLVGEKVYVRGKTIDPIVAPRLMLHAASLQFDHPTLDRRLSFKTPPPQDFLITLGRLGGKLPPRFRGRS